MIPLIMVAYIAATIEAAREGASAAVMRLATALRHAAERIAPHHPPSAPEKIQWNWCPQCAQPVDLPDECHDGSECRCHGCRTIYVATAYDDGSWALEIQEDDAAVIARVDRIAATWVRADANTAAETEEETAVIASWGDGGCGLGADGLPVEEPEESPEAPPLRVAIDGGERAVEDVLRAADRDAEIVVAQTAADVANPRPLALDVWLAQGGWRRSRFGPTHEDAHKYLFEIGSDELGRLPANMRASVERYHVAVASQREADVADPRALARAMALAEGVKLEAGWPETESLARAYLAVPLDDPRWSEALRARIGRYRAAIVAQKHAEEPSAPAPAASSIRVTSDGPQCFCGARAGLLRLCLCHPNADVGDARPLAQTVATALCGTVPPGWPETHAIARTYLCTLGSYATRIPDDLRVRVERFVAESPALGPHPCSICGAAPGEGHWAIPHDMAVIAAQRACSTCAGAAEPCAKCISAGFDPPAPVAPTVMPAAADTPLLGALRAARDLLARPESWLHGATNRRAEDAMGAPCEWYDKDAVRLDIVGALRRAAPDTDVRSDAFVAVGRALGADAPYASMARTAIDVWNDDPIRKHADVLALLDAAIAAEEKRSTLAARVDARLRSANDEVPVGQAVEPWLAERGGSL